MTNLKQIAIIDIKEHGLSVNEASRLYNVPEEELREAIGDTHTDTLEPEIVEEKDTDLIEKVGTAKEVIMNHVLELLQEPMTPKDLKDLLYVTNNIVNEEDGNEGFTVTVKKLLGKYRND